MKKRNQFTKSQHKLLQGSLKRLLGDGLLSEKEESIRPLQSALILDALNLNALNNQPGQSNTSIVNRTIKAEIIKHS